MLYFAYLAKSRIVGNNVRYRESAVRKVSKACHNLSIAYGSKSHHLQSETYQELLMYILCDLLSCERRRREKSLKILALLTHSEAILVHNRGQETTILSLVSFSSSELGRAVPWFFVHWATTRRDCATKWSPSQRVKTGPVIHSYPGSPSLH